jgi:hypothetical protein
MIYHKLLMIDPELRAFTKGGHELSLKSMAAVFMHRKPLAIDQIYWG